jgi:vancomycin aglycone glucosyltransferase
MCAMRVLLSAVGTRGDVQPIVAVALQLRALGHDVRLCIPPNFVEWVRGFGLEAVPVGIVMRFESKPSSTPPVIPDLVADQFETIERAAEGRDVILGANEHQYAARSIAEHRGTRYVTALYSPIALHASDMQRLVWNTRALERVNEHRARLGLPKIADVLTQNLTDRPWLATDPLLDPAPEHVFQTGAWILEDATPLSRELLHFLDRGAPPIYFGFGSMPAPPGTARTLIDAARALGRRAVVSKGWAELEVEDTDDCLAIDDVNQQLLFPRVAAVVHHGGAGTTATAARAGVPQVIVPMFGDQFHWASRVQALGIGTRATLTTEALGAALHEAAQCAARAKDIAPKLPADGASVAARRLTSL